MRGSSRASLDSSKSASKSPELKGIDIRKTNTQTQLRPLTSKTKQQQTVSSSLLSSSSIPSSASTSRRTTEPSQAHPSQPFVKVLNILIGVTGSVATIKLIELLNELHSRFPQTVPWFPKNQPPSSQTISIAIKIITTENARHFIDPVELKRNGDKFEMLHDDHDEWSQWKKVGDPVLHIDLRKWADLFLIAPLDANTMAKMANGICDNLLTCTVRAWDTSKPLIYCPAMNVHMYNHPITREQLSKLQSYGYLRVDSVEKRLACGDVGMGGMASVETISDKVVECLVKRQSCASPTKSIILNSQPTYPIMAVPSSSSPSTSTSNIAHNNNVNNHTINVHKQASPLTLIDIWKKNAISSRPSNSNLIINKKNHNNGLSLLSNRDDSLMRRQSNIVTSIQNLHAIAEARSRQESLQRSLQFHPSYFNNNHDDIELDDMEDCLQDDLNEVDDEMNYNHFDPSRLLEQTLITPDEAMENDEDAMTPPPHTNGGGGVDNFDNNSTINAEYWKPNFNTSRFLSMCQNEERNCFTCAICKNDYKNRKSMARHLREQHVQGNIHRCSPCGTAYKRKEKLVKHIRERHGGRL